MKKVSIGWAIVIAASVWLNAAEELHNETYPVDGNNNPWYVMGGLTIGAYESECVVAPCTYEDYTSGMIIGAGYQVNQYFALEARALRTFWGAGENGGERIGHTGFYLKPSYPLVENLSIYALLGYGWTESIAAGNGNLPEIDESAFSWGLGLGYEMPQYEASAHHWGLFVEYQSLLNDQEIIYRERKSLITIGVFSAGVTYRF